jgi:hypothetical protein
LNEATTLIAMGDWYRDVIAASYQPEAGTTLISHEWQAEMVLDEAFGFISNCIPIINSESVVRELLIRNEMHVL